MTVKLEFEIRQKYSYEKVHIDARSKDGHELPAIDFEKKFYRAEYDGEGCILRFDRNAVPVENLQRGDIVEAAVTSFTSQGDVANFTITGVKKVKG